MEFFISRAYGILVTGGIVLGAWVAERVRQWKIQKGQWKTSKKPEVWDALVWVVIPGVIGARLYHVVDLWGYYRENLLLIPQLWTGGLGIFGALAGGTLGLWSFTKKYEQNFLDWLDLLAVGAPLGQAIGRWGNFFNQELYGKPFDPALGKPPFWFVSIDLENRLEGYEQYTHFQPAFLYESLWNVGVFLVIIWFVRYRKAELKPGIIFTLYILLYAVGRLFLERIKLNVWTVDLGFATVATAQLVSVVIIVISGWILLANTKFLGSNNG